MRSIKLFEAFNSIKLSRTLGFINKSSKKTFLDDVNSICKSIDFPESRLSDEYFDYLPFNKALKKTDMLTDEPCEATSNQVFPGYGIDGEKCNGGKIKRRWGDRIREVVCPICDGTGIKPKISGNIKLIKFWFTNEGNYTAKTMVDGIFRENKIITLSQNRNDYTFLKNIELVRELSNGDYIECKIDGSVMYAFVIRDRYGIYAIQPYKSGDTPYSRFIGAFRWNSISTYSWKISGGYYDWIKLVKKIDKIKLDVDPYTWNTGIRISRNLIRQETNNVKNLLTDAHFAIILDFSKLKKSEFEKKSKIRYTRQESKEGALFLKNDKEIRSQNIERYIKLLSDNFKVSGDITDIDRVIKKLISGKRSVYNIRNGRLQDMISHLMDKYIFLMKSSNKESSISEINDVIKTYITNMMNRNRKNNQNILDIKKKLKINDIEKYFEIIELLDLLGSVISDKLYKIKIETPEDMEVIYQKLIGIKNIMRSSRYNMNKLNSYFDYISRDDIDYSYRYLISVDDVPLVVNSIKTLIKIVKKM